MTRSDLATLYLGVDVSKKELVTAKGQRSMGVFPNTVPGIHRFIQKIHQTARHAVVIVESTGGYERLLLDLLHLAKIDVSRVQPSLVRHFAKSRGVLAKTDKIDAKVLAAFGQTNQPRLTTPARQAEIQLRALKHRRDQIVADRTREMTRLETCHCPLMRDDIQEDIERLDQKAKGLEGKIAQLIASDAELSKKAEVLMTVKGVKEKTASVLLAHLPELGSVNRQAIAALAGVSPYNDDSGTKKGKRSIKRGGRDRLRTALYMAAVTAAKHNAMFRPFYQRLLAAGKSKMTALIAVARKLVIHLNSLVREAFIQPTVA